MAFLRWYMALRKFRSVRDAMGKCARNLMRSSSLIAAVAVAGPFEPSEPLACVAKGGGAPRLPREPCGPCGPGALLGERRADGLLELTEGLYSDAAWLLPTETSPSSKTPASRALPSALSPPTLQAPNSSALGVA
mmetsp:Transcript_42317/g.125552  ORF Transcript_42317/g.125552 Transcript_42317/m.125552 type:complete len:135 (-) Transcript_42317:597-1001(-)